MYKETNNSTLNKLLESHGFQDRLCSHEEAAQMLGISSDTLYTWNSTKRYALRRIKVGALNKYWLSDLVKFLNDRTIGGGA